MPTARKGFGAMVSQLLTPLMDRRIGNAQLTCHLRDRFATGLRQLHRFLLKLCGIGLLHFLHDLCPPSERVYPKLLPFHKFGARSWRSSQWGTYERLIRGTG